MLLNYAKQARRIELDAERIAFFVWQAQQEHYNEQQFQRARLWILYGNWQYRGNDPTLQWDDLHPTDEQVQEASKRTKPTTLIINRHDLRTRLKAAYTDGFAAGQKHSITVLTDVQVEQLRKELHDAINK